MDTSVLVFGQLLSDYTVCTNELSHLDLHGLHRYLYRSKRVGRVKANLHEVKCITRILIVEHNLLK